MKQELSNGDRLIHSTTRIVCTKSNGERSIGTGFYFAYDRKGEGMKKIVLVTNKHVVNDSIDILLTFTKTKSDDSIDYGQKFTETLSIKQSDWLYHSDVNVDLCVLPILSHLNSIETKNGEFYIFPLYKDLLLTPTQISEINPIEDVTMIGYPLGLWDSYNNLPLTRKGITATNPLLDFMSRSEFLIDLACFPGSSGSPVFLFNESGYASRQGLKLNKRVVLLGILYAGPEYNAQGELLIKPVPTTPLKINTRIPTNLGYVIKAEKLLDLESLVSD